MQKRLWQSFTALAFAARLFESSNKHFAHSAARPGAVDLVISKVKSIIHVKDQLMHMETESFCCVSATKNGALEQIKKA